MNYNIENIKLNQKKTKCIEEKDKKKIKNIILNFMICNKEYKFKEIKVHVNKYFEEYIIEDHSFKGILISLKKQKYIKYENDNNSRKWIKEDIFNIV